MDKNPLSTTATAFWRFGTKSFRHLDDSALDVSAPFGTKAFRLQMDGWTGGLAVELPTELKLFTICYGYIFENKRMSRMRILACASKQSQEHLSVIFFFFFFFFSVGGIVFLLPHGSCILVPVDSILPSHITLLY